MKNSAYAKQKAAIIYSAGILKKQMFVDNDTNLFLHQ